MLVGWLGLGYIGSYLPASQVSQETRQYWVWDYDAEEEADDLVTTDLFRAAERTDLDAEIVERSKRKPGKNCGKAEETVKSKASKNKKKAKKDTRKKKKKSKKKSTSSSSSPSSPSPLTSSASSSSASGSGGKAPCEFS